ncbi:hypothetical protein HK103_004204 [Boothiomyces macroporosus]|uniref:Transcription regulator Rua1 C-terminal domain-containing protein n=1 Tax=Boothiomyces macroporosus TaxID=261099 RepID=A0AAD5UHL5_9FUNG|nr:hypothetical protein HK103_004204 [Boothiomyces macroporosus]
MPIQPSGLPDSLRSFPDSEDWVNPYANTYHTLSGTSCPTPSNFGRFYLIVDYFTPLLKRRSTDSHLEQEDTGFNEWSISSHKRTRTASSEATLATSLPNFNSNHTFTRNYIRTRQNSISSSLGYMHISNYNAPPAPISVDIHNLLNYSNNNRVANSDQVVDIHREINSFIYEANNIAAQDSIRNAGRSQVDGAPPSNSVSNSQDSSAPLSGRTESDDVTIFPMDYIKEESSIDPSLFDVSVTQANSDSETQPNSAAMQDMTFTQTIQDLTSSHDFTMSQDFLATQEYSSPFKLINQEPEILQSVKPEFYQEFSIPGENSMANYNFPLSIEAINASFLKRVEEIPSQPAKNEMVVVKKPSPKKQPVQDDPTVRAQDLKFESDLYTPKMVRNTGSKKEGFCDLCKPGRWLQLKNSAFWYHKQFTHGISSISCQPFTNPLEIRTVWCASGPGQSNDESQVAVFLLTEGLCHRCRNWEPLYRNKKRFAHSFISYDEAIKCLTTPHKLQTKEPVILERNPLKLLVGRTASGDLFIPLGMTVSNSMLQDMKSHEAGKMSGVW